MVLNVSRQRVSAPRAGLLSLGLLLSAAGENLAAPDSGELWRSSYEQWASSYGAAASDPAADPDQDALTNFQEFALLTDPLDRGGQSSYQSLRVGTAAGGVSMVYAYQRRADWEELGLSFRVSVSNDLDTWTELEESVLTTMRIEGDFIETVSFRIPAPQDPSVRKQFARLHVQGVEVARGDANWPSTFFLETLDGTNGFVIRGRWPQYALGGSVADAGDVNGDGRSDIAVGALWAGILRDLHRSGETYIIFGRDGGFPAELNVEDLDGTNGFTLLGEFREDLSGIVSSAGDVNGDGIGDLIIGAYQSDAGGGRDRRDTGVAYVVFGRNTAFPATINLASLNGTNGFVIRGVDRFDRTGIAVAHAGDLNGDGMGDLAIGSDIANRNEFSNSGKLYIVYGTAAGFPPVFELNALDGNNGFTIVGSKEYDFVGRDVAAAGDFNGDGVDDLIVGTSDRRKDWETTTVQDFYVLFGNAAGFPPVVSTASLDGTNGFIIRAAFRINFYSGAHVAGGGDLDGDGFPDIVIGNDQDGANPLAGGAVYIVFGGNGAFPPVVDVYDFEDEVRTTVIRGIFHYDYAGSDVALIGDVNGDGIDELLVGAMLADGDDGDENPATFHEDSGEAYVVFGRGDFGNELSFADLMDGVDGFVIPGGDRRDYFGRAVAGLGDVNGDGGPDFIITAHNADRDRDNDGDQESVNTGEAFVIFGLGRLVEPPAEPIE